MRISPCGYTDICRRQFIFRRGLHKIIIRSKQLRQLLRSNLNQHQTVYSAKEILQRVEHNDGAAQSERFSAKGDSASYSGVLGSSTGPLGRFSHQARCEHATDAHPLDNAGSHRYQRSRNCAALLTTRNQPPCQCKSEPYQHQPRAEQKLDVDFDKNKTKAKRSS